MNSRWTLTVSCGVHERRRRAVPDEMRRFAIHWRIHNKVPGHYNPFAAECEAAYDALVAEGAGGVVAVEHGHLHVHEDDIEGLAVLPGGEGGVAGDHSGDAAADSAACASEGRGEVSEGEADEVSHALSRQQLAENLHDRRLLKKKSPHK